jgi:hypothetical protein
MLCHHVSLGLRPVPSSAGRRWLRLNYSVTMVSVMCLLSLREIINFAQHFTTRVQDVMGTAEMGFTKLISGAGCGVNVIFALLGCYAA